MKKYIHIILILLLLALLQARSFASDLFPYKEESDLIIILNKKTNEKRSELSDSFIKYYYKGETIFNFSRKGNGKWDKFVNVSWNIFARLKEKDGILYLLNSTLTVKNQHGNLIVKYEKKFDYGKKVIYWNQFDNNGVITKKARYPIKGKTADESTLMYFLKVYVANKNQPDYKTFYLLTNEPRLYKVNIKIIGQETLDLPIGSKNAVKIKLTADIGIIDDILDRYVPHTYVWYEETPPFEWLQYEGMETGKDSANISGYVTKRFRD